MASPSTYGPKYHIIPAVAGLMDGTPAKMNSTNPRHLYKTLVCFISLHGKN
jgi:hypothetical protein